MENIPGKDSGKRHTFVDLPEVSLVLLHHVAHATAAAAPDYKPSWSSIVPGINLEGNGILRDPARACDRVLLSPHDNDHGEREEKYLPESSCQDRIPGINGHNPWHFG